MKSGSILYQDGKLWLVEVPEKPTGEFMNPEKYAKRFIDYKIACYEKALSEAIKNKLEIVNYHEFFQRLNNSTKWWPKGEAIMVMKLHSGIKDGELYPWPGEYSKDIFNTKVIISLPEQGHEEKKPVEMDTPLEIIGEFLYNSGLVESPDSADHAASELIAYAKKEGLLFSTPKPEPVQIEEPTEHDDIGEMRQMIERGIKLREFKSLIDTIASLYKEFVLPMKVKPVLHDDQDQEAMIGEIISECRVYDGTPTYFLMITRRIKERFTITRKSL